MTSGFAQFKEIRKLYERVLPGFMEEYKRTGRMHHDPYFYNWFHAFSPIEESVWSDIRLAGLPFFPQLPVLKFFLDFGCPFLRIGIECDGKAWHDSELDKKRDAMLADAGWTIFRIEGHECKRIMPLPWDEVEDRTPQEIHDWFMKTSEGVIYAIAQRYFNAEPSQFANDNSHYIDATLFEHNTTPRIVVPHPRQIQTAAGPIRAGSFLEEYIQSLCERARAAL
jgi:hypothetical protein